MNLCEFEKSVEKKIGQGRERVIRYALDAAIFPDDVYIGFAKKIEQGIGAILTELERYPYTTRLVWARRFFEVAHGNDPWKSFKTLFLDERRQELNYNSLRQFASRLPWKPFDHLECFLEETWLVGGGKEEDEDNDANVTRGKTSNIWRFLSPLLRQCPDCPTDENILDIVRNYRDDISNAPVYFSKLIDAEDTTFFQSLCSLRTGRGVGWMSRISGLWQQHASRASATVDWRLFVNGKMRRIDLSIRNVYFPSDSRQHTINIRQENRVVWSRSMDTGQTSLSIPYSSLLNDNFSSQVDFAVFLNSTKVEKQPSPDETLINPTFVIFRMPLKYGERFLPIVGSKEHIDTRKLVVMTNRIQPPVIKLGDVSLTVCPWGNVDVSSTQSCSLYEVVIPPNSTSPAELSINGEKCCFIGHKPYISIADSLVDDHLLADDEDVRLIRGAEFDIEVHCVPDAQTIKWTGENINFSDTTASKCSVTLPRTGEISAIRCGCARVRVMGLPKEYGDWTPDHIATEFFQNGQERGTYSEISGVRFQRPLNRLCWWWEERYLLKMESLNKPKDFNDHAELRKYRLCLWNPPGRGHPLSFNNGSSIITLTSVDAECYGNIDLSEVVSPYLSVEDIGNHIDSVCLGNTEIANILRVPLRPTLSTKNGKPIVFFPNGFSAEKYSIIVCFESGIVSESIESVSCAGMTSGRIHQISVKHNQINGEGIWLILILAGQAITRLFEFIIKRVHIESELTVYTPDENILLPARLGCQPATDIANKIYACLDWMARQPIFERTVLFRETIRDREYLQYTSNVEFWVNYFKEKCCISDNENGVCELEHTLALMIKVGSNPFAVPKWLGNSLELIKDCMGWKTYKTVGHWDIVKKQLKRVCPPMLVQRAIEAGFPQCDETDYPSFGLIERLYRDTSGLFQIEVGFPLPLPDGRNFIVKRHGDIGFPDGNHNINMRLLEFVYGETKTVQIRKTDEPFRIGLKDKREKCFLDKYSHGESYDFHEINIPEDTFQKLSALFDQSLSQFEPDDGLRSTRYMFTLLAQHYDVDGSVSMRSLIYRVAVLSRLHAWLGRKSDGYPQNWCLADSSNYSLLSGGLRIVWNDETARKLFFKEVIHVDWMLAWFSYY
jgi:hypothetical protein